MDQELGPKELKGALGEGTLVEADPQGGGAPWAPAQIEGGARRRLVVGDPIVRLKKEGNRQKAGRDARTPIVQRVEGGELLVGEDLVPLARQEAVEGPAFDEVEVEVIRLEDPPLRRSLAEHSALQSPDRADYTRSPKPAGQARLVSRVSRKPNVPGSNLRLTRAQNLPNFTNLKRKEREPRVAARAL